MDLEYFVDDKGFSRGMAPLPAPGVVWLGGRTNTGGGTQGTIGSGAYERAIKAIAPEAHVTARACPLFVPLVEEGWTEHEAARLVAREYLEPLRAEAIDTLVLGCTHYPLLKPLIAEIIGDSVQLIDSAAETAAETARTGQEIEISEG